MAKEQQQGRQGPVPGQQSPQKGLDGTVRAQEGGASEFQARQVSAQSGSGAGAKEESLKRRATCSGARLCPAGALGVPRPSWLPQFLMDPLVPPGTALVSLVHLPWEVLRVATESC